MTILKKITVPQETVNDESLTIIKIHVSQGQAVQSATVLADVESSKALSSITAEIDGFVLIRCKEGEDIGVGEVIFEIADSPETGKQSSTLSAAKDSAPVKQKQLTDVVPIFSEKALELMKHHNIGKDKFANIDFVNVDAVNALLGIKKEKPLEVSKHAVTKNFVSTPGTPVDAFKKREIEFLKDVNSVGLVSKIDVHIHADRFDEAVQDFQKIIFSTPLPLIIFECSRILQSYRNLNAYFLNDSIVHYDTIDIGFATDMGKGLKVLTIHNSNKKSLEEIENEVLRLIDAYTTETLEKKDLVGAGFTITDLFTSSATNVFPLINKHNAAIIGVTSRDHTKQSFVVTCSFDHRVSNGKEVSNFLGELQRRLETYFSTGSHIVRRQERPNRCYKCFRETNDDLNGKVHFINITKNGSDELVCSLCLSGW